MRGFALLFLLAVAMLPSVEAVKKKYLRPIKDPKMQGLQASADGWSGAHAPEDRSLVQSDEESRKDPRVAGLTPNYAKHKPVRLSSIDPGSLPSAAVDGDTWGVFEEEGSFAATQPETSPWIEVELQRTQQVEAVEVWMPTRKCERYLRKLEPPEKASIDHMLKEHKRPPLFCRGGWPSFEPSKAQPLKLQLLDASGTEIIASTDFQSRSLVYSWNDLDVAAQVLRISVAGGSSVQLHVAEVKVYGPRGSLPCGPGTCLHGGTCTKAGTCLCPPNMVGPQCEYNIQGTDHFLPHDLDHGWWNGQTVAAFQHLMSSLMSNCKDPRKMRKHGLLPGSGAMGAGLGSTMYYRTGIMTEAFQQKSAYLYFGHFNYALNDYCRSLGEYGTFECYFQGTTKCPSVTQTLRNSFHFPSPHAKGPKGEDCLIPKRGKGKGGCKAGPEYTTVPGTFLKSGLYWWRMLQVSLLMRPTVATLEMLKLQELKASIGFQHPIIGVHLRSGDGCRYGVRARLFDCRTLEDYLPDIRTLSQKYGTKRVFLSTDDANAVRDTQVISEFDWVVVPSNRSAFMSDVKIEQRLTGQAQGTPALDQHQTMVSTLQDLFLLSEADYLVTHQASTMSRLALQLGSLFHRRIPPFVSMDGPWCPHWRMCCEPDHKTGASKEC